MRTHGLGLVALAVLVTSAGAFGHGIIIESHWPTPVPTPRPPLDYRIESVDVDATVRDQVASVQVTQTLRNPSRATMQVEYWFPLPDQGAIQDFVLLVDGKELPGKLLRREEARRIYESIVRSQKDPALLEYMGMGLFRTSVFPIPAGAKRTITLRYTQVCKRDHDVVSLTYPMYNPQSAGRPIERLAVNVSIESGAPIKSVYSPSHDVTVTRAGDHRAAVHLEQHHVGAPTDFRLLYTVADGDLGASVLSYLEDGEHGYFMLLASPRVTPAGEPSAGKNKTIVCVLDRSGSMAGQKIEQARGALRFVLNNLNEGDLFNIVVYDSRVETFRPELERFDDTSRKEALAFVDNIHSGGSTNIDEALRTAMSMLHVDGPPAYVLFLTDGLPTAGEKREVAIADNCKAANKVRARVFPFGVGYDVNARLLDRLSAGNGGTSVYVQPDEDIEEAVANLYRKFTTPVLTDIQITLDGTTVNRAYPTPIPDLFAGGQIVWVGRYSQSGNVKVRITGNAGDAKQTFFFPASLADVNSGGAYAFVAKLWAVRRIGQIIDDMDLNGQNKELIDELVALSTRYGIITPYTSFLADETGELDAVAGADMASSLVRSELSKTQGVPGVVQRRAKARYKTADRAQSAGESVMLFGDADDGARAQHAIRQIGDKTFYRRDGQWIDSTVMQKEQEAAVRIIMFSDAYFKLVRSQSAALNRYLTFREPVTVRIKGKVYQVVIE
ncbi:MAG: hypothetical protein CMJ21_04335 [Phycisphaerae bacterium]|nr:hypothetical protein [Phycisphaerae bacterium]